MPKPQRTSDEMFPLIERYLASKKTQKAFCAAEGLSVAVFTYWLARYRREHARSLPAMSSGAFIEITPPAAEQPLMEVVYPSGVRLRFFRPVEVAFVGRLVTAS